MKLIQLQLPEEMRNKIKEQNWPGLQIKKDLEEGWVFFTQSGIKKGDLVRNYGGDHLYNVAHLPESARDYLLEFSVVKASIRYVHYMYHGAQTKFAFGKYINHSSKHPVLTHKVFMHNEIPALMFVATKHIPAGSELCYNYGCSFTGVSECLSSCIKCSKIRAKKV